ncbi:MAG: universal stress protein [Hydrogenovibrio sp.]|uniref:universal stress protein n=1 Tax=Hydrogenovibrio sp. TaxID=2065821 RepID=UPI00286FD8C8|nr:universal stress protein [Hydrogenovibrio sp.]MDR9499956.1 universal stress protein [Hydrogenovibrio sp.]
MRVVSLVNGSLLSEAASFYAISYAKSVQLPLTFLFVDNGHESVEKFQSSLATLEEIAQGRQVPFESVILKGDVIAQLQHFAQLYSIDTVFCATRKLSNTHSFSEKIVHSGIQTAIAVVKVKNVSQVRSFHRVLLSTGETINPHCYLLWIGLISANGALGKLYLQNNRSVRKASGKSGLKYAAAPFVQLAGMLKQRVEVVQVLQPINPALMNNYLVENDLDLVIFNARAHSPKTLNQVTDQSSTNSILFYPWKVE